MKHNQGFIALSSILVIGAVILTIGAGATYTAVGELQAGLSSSKGAEIMGLVEGCTEEALLKARADATYNGGIMNRAEGTCSVSILSKSGVTWTINVQSTGQPYNRIIEVIFNRNASGISLTSWKEI